MFEKFLLLLVHLHFNIYVLQKYFYVMFVVFMMVLLLVGTLDVMGFVYLVV